MTEAQQPKPRGFGLCTRIVYVHQGLSAAFFLAGLRLHHTRGVDALLLQHLGGIVVSLVILAAMVGVASRRSLKALGWLRLILWISVAKLFVVQLWLSEQGITASSSAIRTVVINASIALPLALYWSRPVHRRYLASGRA